MRALFHRPPAASTRRRWAVKTMFCLDLPLTLRSDVGWRNVDTCPHPDDGFSAKSPGD
jgi:hypothetical protein